MGNRNYESLCQEKVKELSERKSEVPLETMFHKIRPVEGNVYGQVHDYEGLGLILEWNPINQPHAYPGNLPLEFEGFFGLSVTADQDILGGCYTNLLRMKENPLEIPLLQNDLIIDPYQVYQARFLGTTYLPLYPDTVSDNELLTLYLLSRQYGMEGVLHVSNEKELEKANNTPTLFLSMSEVDYFGDSMDLRQILELSEEVPETRKIFTRLKEFDEDKIEHLYDAEINAVILPYPESNSELKRLIKTLRDVNS